MFLDFLCILTKRRDQECEIIVLQGGRGDVTTIHWRDTDVRRKVCKARKSSGVETMLIAMVLFCCQCANRCKIDRICAESQTTWAKH
jgi:hypothetical protein